MNRGWEPMGRRPPTGSNAIYAATIYRIDRAVNLGSSTYQLRRMGRKPVRLSNRAGFFVRYNGYWFKLRPEIEMRPLLDEAQQCGIFIMCGDNSYDPAKHMPRPFFLSWENPVAQCAAIVRNVP